MEFRRVLFRSDVSKYFKEKKEISLKEDDVFSDVIIKTKKQLENAITLFKELILRRKKKLLSLVLIAAEIGISKQDFENMFDFEKKLFEDFTKCMDDSDKNLNEILNNKKKKVQKNELVVFLMDVEGFMDLEGEKMGPYEKGQIVNLPIEIIKILIEGGKVEVVGD